MKALQHERITLPMADLKCGDADLELMTAKELEALLKIDVKTIYSYVERGLIPYVRIQSNVRFIKRQIFDRIADHNYRPRAFRSRPNGRAC